MAQEESEPQLSSGVKVPGVGLLAQKGDSRTEKLDVPRSWKEMKNEDLLYAPRDPYALGSPLGAQAQLAIQFYQQVAAANRGATISVAGRAALN